MTAVANGKSTISKSRSTHLMKNLNDELDDEDSSSSSSSGSEGCNDLKQRKKELIMQKQLERRQQQELIRQQREEERARKAEELRLKEEELAYKKQLEKTRKETIFQAYIDKKKQLQDESQTGYHFGTPSASLLNAKKYHSTYRLKQSPSATFNQQQKQLIDQFEQASITSDRSANLRYNQQAAGNQSQMIKSKCLLFIYFVHLFNGY